jgi:hypothetical protein
MCTLDDAADVNPVPIKFLRHALQRASQELVELQEKSPTKNKAKDSLLLFMSAITF